MWEGLFCICLSPLPGTAFLHLHPNKQVFTSLLASSVQKIYDWWCESVDLWQDQSAIAWGRGIGVKQLFLSTMVIPLFKCAFFSVVFYGGIPWTKAWWCPFIDHWIYISLGGKYFFEHATIMIASYRASSTLPYWSGPSTDRIRPSMSLTTTYRNFLYWCKRPTYLLYMQDFNGCHIFS